MVSLRECLSGDVRRCEVSGSRELERCIGESRSMLAYGMVELWEAGGIVSWLEAT